MKQRQIALTGYWVMILSAAVAIICSIYYPHGWVKYILFIFSITGGLMLGIPLFKAMNKEVKDFKTKHGIK